MANSNDFYNSALEFAKKNKLPIHKGELVFKGKFKTGAAFAFRKEPVIDEDGFTINPPQTGYPTYIYTDGSSARFMNSIEINELWSAQ